jgi:hypothetical protein
MGAVGGKSYVQVAFPASEIVAVGLPASLLKIDNVPVAAPLATGAKRTVTVCRPPGATVNGADGDTAENGPSAVMLLTTRLATPVFDIVTVRSLYWPALTFPKSRLPGVTEIAGGVMPTRRTQSVRPSGCSDVGPVPFETWSTLVMPVAPSMRFAEPSTLVHCPAVSSGPTVNTAESATLPSLHRAVTITAVLKSDGSPYRKYVPGCTFT